MTPLTMAARNKSVNIICALCNGHADPNIPEDTGIYPLHIAIFNGHEPSVQMLIAYRANIYFSDPNGLSPVELALACGQMHIARYLRSMGA